jgi:hypothetical protein
MLREEVLTLDEFLESAGMAKATKFKKGSRHGLEYYKELGVTKELKKAHSEFVNELTKAIDEASYDARAKAVQAGMSVEKRLGEALKKTHGRAAPIKEPMPPTPPGVEPPFVAPTRTPSPQPGEVPPIVEPPQIAKPGYDQSPELSPAQGFAEHAGDWPERPLLRGSTNPDLTQNPIAKLSALKYLTGAKAAPVAGAYLAAKGLTSPTAGGVAARMTFKQGGIQAILSWAQQYPSYHDGVLENPQERRSLTKEIEDDPDMPLEQKAIAQSKVNRGKRMDGNLH